MSKLNILTVLLLILTLKITAQSKTINIDVTKNDKLNISQIAEGLMVIPLNFIDMDEPSVSQVVLSNKHIYVLISYNVGTDPEGIIYQINMEGKLIGEVGSRDAKSNGFNNPLGLFYSEEKKELHIVYNDFIAIYDENRKLKRKIESIRIKGIYHIFNNRFWELEKIIDMDNKQARYKWISTDLSTLKTDTIFSYLRLFSEERIFSGTSFSDADDILYFTHDYENEIIGIDIHNKVDKVYTFNFINTAVDLSGNVVHPRRNIFSRYINYGYKIRPGERYCFIYDKKNEKGYNIRLRRSEGRKLLSGINDDFLNTGYFEIKSINSSDYGFFTKQGFEVSSIINGIENERNPVLFLIKFK